MTTLDAAWAWAYPMRSIAGPIGYMVVCAEREPTVEEQFLAQVVAQQTGVAVSNARLHAGSATSPRSWPGPTRRCRRPWPPSAAACRSTSA